MSEDKLLIENEKLNSLITEIESSIKDGRFRHVLNLIGNNKEIESYPKEIRSKLISYEITCALRLEDYNLLLNLLNEKRSLNQADADNDSSILFYEAIAFEALDEVEYAIASLNKIQDNISRHSLINKYLKLALLYLKNNEYDKAKSAYDYAALVDFNHKNEMFSLVESDLYYATGNYTESLRSFEKFFLSSTNKYKYIDRYILIEMKLNHLDEAYEFYTQYKDKDDIKLSSTNKYRFYKASLELLKKLDREIEARDIEKELENIKPHYSLKEEKELSGIISSITKLSLMPLTRYDAAKNIIHKFYKLIKGLDINPFFYIEKENGKYKFYEALDSRMREKELSYEDISSNNLEEYFIDSFDIKPYFINQYFERIDENFILLNLSNEYNNFGRIVLKFKESYRVIYDVLKDSIISILLRLKVLKEDNKKLDELLTSLSKKNYGLISFNGNEINLLNDVSRNIFNSKTSLITFNYLSKISSEEVFASSFEDEKVRIINITINDETKTIRFSPYTFNGSKYSLVEDVSNSLSKEEKNEDFLKHSGIKFYNEESLKEIVLEKKDSYAVLGLTINMISKSDSLSLRNDKLDLLYKYLIQLTPSSTLFYLGENHYLILLNSTDKRIIESLFKQIESGIKALYRVSDSLRTSNVIGFATKALKNRGWKEVEEILQYGYLLAERKDGFIFIDNEEKRRYALYKTYEMELIRLLKEEKLNVEYVPIIDKDNNIHYFMAKFILPYEMDSQTYESIITSNNLESKCDLVLCDKVFNELMQYNKNVRVVIRIHKETIFNDNFIKKCSLLFKKCHLDNRVIFQIENIDQSNYNKNVNSLFNSGIKLSTTFSSIKDLKDMDKYKLIFINFDSNNQFISLIAKSLKESTSSELVLFNNKTDYVLTLNMNVRTYKKEDMIKL